MNDLESRLRRSLAEIGNVGARSMPDGTQRRINVPTRPADFEAWVSAAGVDESPGCLSAPKDFVHHSGEFSDAGRQFALYVAYGTSVSPETLSEFWAILNGMSFEVSSAHEDP